MNCLYKFRFLPNILLSKNAMTYFRKYSIFKAFYNSTFMHRKLSTISGKGFYKGAHCVTIA